MVPVGGQPDAGRSRFTIIDGPKIASKSNDGGRSIRSELMTRILRERNRPGRLHHDQSTSYPVCHCNSIQRASSPQVAAGLRRILPSTARETVTTKACPVCGGQYWTGRVMDRNEHGESPSTALDSGRVDPFMSSRRTLGGHKYDELIEYCVRDIWPGFRASDNYPGKFYQTWVVESGGDPLVLHAHMFAAYVHKESLLIANGVDQPLRTWDHLRHKGQALKLVRELVADPAKEYVLDDLIVAIIYLAVNERAPFASPMKDPNPFTPPLPNAQWLEMYTSREVDPTHWNAVNIILQNHGGIQALTKHGLAWLIGYAGLMVGTTTTTTPLYPLIDPGGKLFTYKPPLRMFDIAEPPRHLFTSGGFNQLRSIGVTRNLVRVFLDLSELTQAIEFYTDEAGNCNLPDIDNYGDCRNMVQHRLLSTPDRLDPDYPIFQDEIPASQHSMLMYLACRDAALLFGLHVIFPIAQSKTTRNMLLLSLQNTILELEQPSEATTMVELLFWCTMIGGISADDSPFRGWYAAQLSKYSSLMTCYTWEDARLLMSLYPWLGTACDGAGHAFWTEVQALVVESEASAMQDVFPQPMLLGSSEEEGSIVDEGHEDLMS